MKSIGKLKITQLSKIELSKREQNHLKGGENCCICGCGGPSSSTDNHRSNTSSGLVSPGWSGLLGGAYA